MFRAIQNERGLTIIGLVVLVLIMLGGGVLINLVNVQKKVGASKRMGESLDRLALAKWVIVAKDCTKTIALNPTACTPGSLVAVGKLGTSPNPLIKNDATTKLGDYFLRAKCEGNAQKKFFVEARDEDSSEWKRLTTSEVFTC